MTASPPLSGSAASARHVRAAVARLGASLRSCLGWLVGRLSRSPRIGRTRSRASRARRRRRRRPARARRSDRTEHRHERGRLGCVGEHVGPTELRCLVPHVRGHLAEVESEARSLRDVLHEHLPGPSVALTERVRLGARTFRSDATFRGSVCFRASVVPRSRPFASVAVERGSPISSRGAQPHSSGLFPECVIRVVSHVINHSVALDAIMMG